MPSEIKAFKCNYCPRCFGRKVNALQHESCCIANPARHHCKTCVHSCIKSVHHHTDGVFNKAADCMYPPDDYDANEPCCDVYDEPIHNKPYEIQSDEYYDFSCHNYEYKGYFGYDKKGI